MKISEQLLIKLIRSSVLQTEEDFSDYSDFDEWRDLFVLCSNHSIVGMIYDKFVEVFGDKIPDSLAARLKHTAFTEMSFQAVRSQSFKRVYDELIADGFNLIVLKGELLRKLYPQPESRTSLDEDLLVDKNQYEELKNRLISMGFEEANESDGDKHWVNKKLSLYFEIHFEPFSNEKSYKKWNNIFANYSERIINSDGIISLSSEDNFIFLMLHAAKHFIYSGVGLKQVLDIAVFMKNYQDEMDFSYVKNALKNTNTLLFAKEMTAFIKENLLENVYCFGEDKADSFFINDILNAGSLGQSDESRKHSANVTASAFKGDSKYINIIFPPRERLTLKYPFCKKYPILLPVAWAMRLASYLFRRKKSSALKTGNERLRMLKKYGLIR